MPQDKRTSKPTQVPSDRSSLQVALLGASLLGITLGLSAFAYRHLVPEERPTLAGAPTESGLARAGQAREGHAVQMDDVNAGYIGINAGFAFQATGQLDDVLVASPAYQAGLRRGDMVLEIDGVPTTIPSQDPSGPRHQIVFFGAPKFSVDLNAWQHFGGGRGTEVALRVRDKGEIRVLRKMARQEVIVAWRWQRLAEAQAEVAKHALEVGGVTPEITAARKALGSPPAWMGADWQAHAAQARVPLQSLIAKHPKRLALRASMNALKSRSHSDFVAAMARMPDYIDLAMTDPCCDATLPVDLRAAYRISAVMEAHRLGALGQYEAAVRLAERAEFADVSGELESSFSEDDPRCTAEIKRLQEVLSKLDELAAHQRAARKELDAATRSSNATRADLGEELGSV